MKQSVKRSVCLLVNLCILTTVLTCFPSAAYASEPTTKTSSTVEKVGDYYIITEVAQRVNARSSTTSGHKTTNLVDGDMNKLCSLTVYADFVIDGSTVKCTYSKGEGTVYKSSWSVADISTTKGSGTTGSATANATYKRKFLGIVVERHPASVTITCDKYGNVY